MGSDKMTLLWADGFDHYGTNDALHQQGVYGGAFQVGNGSGRTGTTAMYLSEHGDSNINLPSVGPRGFWGFAFYTEPYGDDRRFVFLSGGNPQFGWKPIQGGGIAIFDYDNQDHWLWQSPNNIIQLNSWCYIEWGWQSDTGTITLRVNGKELVTLAGANIGNGNINGLHCRVGTAGTVYLDDFVWYNNQGAFNNGFLGDVRCRTLYPASNGPSQQWVATGDAVAFQAIGHVPGDNNANYVAGANVGDASDFGVQGLPINTAHVFGVVQVSQLSKTDAGACVVQPSLESGQSSADGVAVNPGVGMGYYQSVFETDPAGGGPLTRAAVNAMRIKYTRTA